jgi:hypothetical protein
MNDWAHSCFAKALADAIGDAAAPDRISGTENPQLGESASPTTSAQAH